MTASGDYTKFFSQVWTLWESKKLKRKVVCLFLASYVIWIIQRIREKLYYVVGTPKAILSMFISIVPMWR